MYLNRPYFNKQIPELEKITSENWSSIPVLTGIFSELNYRAKHRDNGLKKRPKLLKSRIQDRIKYLNFGISFGNGKNNMTIRRDENNVIINADELNVDDVANEHVLCPACKDFIFKQWPLGWDAHSAHKCAGIAGTNEKSRKSAFKFRYQHLFR